MSDQISEQKLAVEESYDEFKGSVEEFELAKDAARIYFILLDRQKAEYKAFLENYKKAVHELIAYYGLDAYFQDDEGVVYKTAEQIGKFVYFEPRTVLRTRREGEEKGSLSMKEARDNGFEVERK